MDTQAPPNPSKDALAVDMVEIARMKTDLSAEFGKLLLKPNYKAALPKNVRSLIVNEGRQNQGIKYVPEEHLFSPEAIIEYHLEEKNIGTEKVDSFYKESRTVESDIFTDPRAFEAVLEGFRKESSMIGRGKGGDYRGLHELSTFLSDATMRRDRDVQRFFSKSMAFGYANLANKGTANKLFPATNMTARYNYWKAGAAKIK